MTIAANPIKESDISVKAPNQVTATDIVIQIAIVLFFMLSNRYELLIF